MNLPISRSRMTADSVNVRSSPFFEVFGVPAELELHVAVAQTPDVTIEADVSEGRTSVGMSSSSTRAR